MAMDRDDKIMAGVFVSIVLAIFFIFYMLIKTTNEESKIKSVACKQILMDEKLSLEGLKSWIVICGK